MVFVAFFLAHFLSLKFVCELILLHPSPTPHWPNLFLDWPEFLNSPDMPNQIPETK